MAKDNAPETDRHIGGARLKAPREVERLAKIGPTLRVTI